MPVLTSAALIGGAMAAGGTAAAIRAQKANTGPRGVAYGGDPYALDDYRRAYGMGQAEGADLRNAGLLDMAGIGGEAADTRSYGQDLIDSSLAQRTGANYQALQDVQAAGHQAELAARYGSAAALEQAANKNTALASAAGPMGLRMAMAENAQAGAVAASDLATIQAQNRLATGQAMAQQRNIGDQLVLAQRDANLRQAGLGAGLLGQGYDAGITTASAPIQSGIATEGRYLDAMQNVEQAQLMADLDYERRRQADAQRKSQNLISLGAGLIGGGAQVMRAGWGGGYGGGGGGG